MPKAEPKDPIPGLDLDAFIKRVSGEGQDEQKKRW